MSSSSSDDGVYEVDKIVSKRKRGKVDEYLVRWKGYSNRHDSWEPVSNLTGCVAMIKQFNADFQGRTSQRVRKPTSRDLYSLSLRTSRSQRRMPKPFSNSSKNKSRSLRKDSRFFKKTTSAKQPMSVKKAKVEVGRLSPFSSRFNLSLKEERLEKVSYSTSTTTPLTPALQSVNISSANNCNLEHTVSVQSPKIFAATDNRENVKHWLSCKVPILKSRSVASQEDHDYHTRTSEAYRRILPKEPIDFQPQETNENSITSAARKSSLRKKRIYQERLVLMQWRKNFVEIIFANTSRKNGLTPRFLTELSNALDAVAASKCSVVVVNTVGNIFCSGLDVHFLIESLTSSNNIRETTKQIAESIRNFVDKLIEFKRILIAVVQGPAVNLGCTMLSLFDIVYCSDKAWFWTPYVEMGQSSESCSSLLFPQILGQMTANNMLLNCAKLTADEAKQQGLVTEVFPHDTLKRNAMALVDACASRSYETIQVTKSLMRSENIEKLKLANCKECEELAKRWSSQDFLDRLLRFASTSEI